MAVARTQSVISTVDAGFRPKDISDEILKLRPDSTQVLSLLMAMQRRPAVDDYEFRMNVQEQNPNTVTLTGVNGGASTVTVSSDDAKYIYLGQTLRYDYDSVYYVTAISGTTITLNSVSGLAGTEALILGAPAAEELSGRPTQMSFVPTQLTNYVQTLRITTGESTHSESTRFYGGQRGDLNREQLLWEAKRLINKEMIMGVKADTTQTGSNGSQKLYKTGGLLNLIATNVHSFGSNQITWDKMRTNMVTDGRFITSPDPWLLVSRTGHSLVEKIVRDYIVPTDTKTGSEIDITTFRMGGKRIRMMICDDLTDGLDDTMVLVDPDALELVTTKNQKTGVTNWMIEETIPRKIAGTDGSTTEFYCAFGLRLNGEKRCAIWDGAQSVGA